MAVIVTFKVRARSWRGQRQDWNSLQQKIEAAKKEVRSQYSNLGAVNVQGSAEQWEIGTDDIHGRERASVQVHHYPGAAPYISLLIDHQTPKGNSKKDWNALQWHWEELIQSFTTAMGRQGLQSQIEMTIEDRWGNPTGVSGYVPGLWKSIWSFLKQHVGLATLSTLAVGVYLWYQCEVTPKCQQGDDIKLAIYPVALAAVVALVLSLFEFTQKPKVIYYVDV